MSSLEYNLKLEALLNEWKTTQNEAATLQQALLTSRLQLKELQAENQTLRTKLSSEETLLSSGVSVLATLLWKASDSPRVIKPLLKAKSKLSCFFEFFAHRLAKCAHLADIFQLSKEDADLIHSLGGFLVNLLVSRQGCDVTLSDDCGRELLSKIVHLLDRLDERPPENQTQDCGKAIFLMILYNTSLEPTGAQLFKDNKTLVEALCRDFLQDGDKQMKVLELRLLHSLLSQHDPVVLQTVKTMLPTENLMSFAREMSDSKEVASLIKEMVEGLKSLAELYDIAEVLQCPLAEKSNSSQTSEEDLVGIDEDHVTKLLCGSKVSPVDRNASTESSSLCFDIVNVK